MAAGALNGIIYVVGGQRRDFTPLARVDAYNVATNTWSKVASMPEARVFPNGATPIMGKLYVSGGRRPDRQFTRTLFVYDPGTNAWSRKADMPRPSCGGAQGVIGGRLYVYTGCYTQDVPAVFFRYDPTTDQWTVRAPPPLGHKGGAGAVVNGRFYLAGGGNWCGTGCDNINAQLDVYDPAANTWSTKAPLSNIRSGMAAAGLGGKFYAVGGDDEFQVATVEAYTPSTNRWNSKAPLPKATTGGAIAVAGGKLFYISGTDMQSPVTGPSRLYAYTP